jgi:MoaA/NifB/PqqE/SkfB family radical SAM enzyme
MNTASLSQAIRNFVVRVEIAVNRALDRQFIPRDRNLFHIETSSACNLKCRFCAYTKKSTPTVSMSYESFVEVVQQALALGYRRFELTPCTGDVYMDRTLMRKLAFLEEHAEVESYETFTNFTIPKVETVKRLSELKKLRHLTISVYGHDRESFVAISGGTPMLYQRLLTNLETLLALAPDVCFGIAIGLRSTRKRQKHAQSELMRIVERYRAAGHEIWLSPGVYNNWGGYITGADVAGLDMQINSTEGAYKFGACEKLFDSVQVLASGVVNACACRDVDATLQIGNTHSQKLSEIVSADNPRYMAIIEQQQRGEFGAICRSCDFYKSIYHHRSHYRRDGIATVKLEEFRKQLNTAAAAVKERAI